jgi:poly-gamma-glutamate capsule biosynthesis protein CapA/YwtB (metallophosphatase superfamily)
MHIVPFEQYAKGVFKIAFLGDIMCENRALGSVVNGNPFKYLQRWLGLHDYVVGNLETTFSGETSDYPIFSTNDLFADYLQGHVNALFTANNHCYDYEEEGLIRTIDVLDDFSIKHIGTSKRGQIRRILDVDLANHSLSLINFTQFINGKQEQPSIYQGSALPEEEAGTISFYTQTAAKETINTAKKRSELVVIGLHQDVEEKVRAAGEEQRRVLKTLHEDGADVVIGMHPHYFQGAELQDNGRIIVYSLGNFFSTMSTPDYPINCGCVLIMNCDGFSNIAYSFLPVATVKESNGENYYVIPLAPLETGAYRFVDVEERALLIKELTAIRETLAEHSLTEEQIPVYFL